MGTVLCLSRIRSVVDKVRGSGDVEAGKGGELFGVCRDGKGIGGEATGVALLTRLVDGAMIETPRGGLQNDVLSVRQRRNAWGAKGVFGVSLSRSTESGGSLGGCPKSSGGSADY